MTAQELKETYPQIKCSIGVGPGWHGLIEKFCEEINKFSLDCSITCIKEKFGGLRIYTSCNFESMGRENCNKVFNLETLIEGYSYKICEECGTRETVTSEGRWIKTLCKSCRDIKNAQKK